MTKARRRKTRTKSGSNATVFYSQGALPEGSQKTVFGPVSLQQELAEIPELSEYSAEPSTIKLGSNRPTRDFATSNATV